MTHMGTSLHVHAFASDAEVRRVMGHVDASNVLPRAVLRLPVPRSAQCDHGARPEAKRTLTARMRTR